MSAIRTKYRQSLAAIGSAVILHLPLMFSAVSAAQEAPSTNAAETDVERLRGLLLRHQGADITKVATDPPAADLSLQIDLASKESALSAALAAPYSSEKVLLHAEDLPLLVAELEARLNDNQAPDRRGDASLIGTVQIRKGGSLVGSSRYSLTHIGKHQFFGYAELAQGRNILGVADTQWEIELPTRDSAERYLLVLVAQPREDWELHALPASAITQLGDAQPQWLQESSSEASPTP